MRTVELHETEFEAILLGLAYAAGVAQEKNRGLSYTFLWAANALNRGNRHWKIFELPRKLKPYQVIQKFMVCLKEKNDSGNDL